MARINFDTFIHAMTPQWLSVIIKLVFNYFLAQACSKITQKLISSIIYYSVDIKMTQTERLIFRADNRYCTHCCTHSSSLSTIPNVWRLKAIQILKITFLNMWLCKIVSLDRMCKFGPFDVRYKSISLFRVSLLNPSMSYFSY